jgi:hypothetical protein
VLKKESDIAEIMRTLDSHAEDITDLRILVGHLVNDVANHQEHLELNDNTLGLHGEKLLINDQKFSDQQNQIDANIETIASHGQTLNEHSTSIKTNTDGIVINGQLIQGNANSIQANTQTIQSLSDNFFAFQNSLVKFHVESNLPGSVHWPSNTGIHFMIMN